VCEAYGIIQSCDQELIALCHEIGREIGLSVTVAPTIPSFLLALHEDDFSIAILDCVNSGTAILDWVRLIRRLRPKVPLIVICDQIDQTMGGKIHEQGVFYLYIRPVHQEILRDVCVAALKQTGAPNRPSKQENDL